MCSSALSIPLGHSAHFHALPMSCLWLSKNSIHFRKTFVGGSDNDCQISAELKVSTIWSIIFSKQIVKIWHSISTILGPEQMVAIVTASNTTLQRNENHLGLFWKLNKRWECRLSSACMTLVSSQLQESVFSKLYLHSWSVNLAFHKTPKRHITEKTVLIIIGHLDIADWLHGPTVYVFELYVTNFPNAETSAFSVRTEKNLDFFVVILDYIAQISSNALCIPELHHVLTTG